MLYLVDEELRYEASGAVFKYERLVHADLTMLRYLVQLRGNFDQELFDRASIAVAMRGWEHVYGHDGLIPYPLRLPATAITPKDADAVARLVGLDPTLTQPRRDDLHGVFWVLSRLPLDTALTLVPELAAAVRALSPEIVKKSSEPTLSGDCSSSIQLPAMNSHARIADDANGGRSPVMGEA